MENHIGTYEVQAGLGFQAQTSGTMENQTGEEHGSWNGSGVGLEFWVYGYIKFMSYGDENVEAES